MPKINKNTDLKPFKKFCLGKGTIEFLPFDLLKDGTPIGDLSSHWIKLQPVHSFHVECNPDVKCPICEMLKPKTRWQKLKIRISKLWKRLAR